MKVLIIDNEVNLRTAIRVLLEAFCSEITSIETADGVKSGLAKISSYKPDILLLDVEMEDGTGFDLMRQVPDPSFQLIFVTAHNQYAIEAFKFSAIDYLLKPIDPDALQKGIHKAIGNIRSNNLHRQVQILLEQLSGVKSKEHKIVLKDIDNTWFVKVSDILYCEAEGTYTRFYLSGEAPILVSKNLKEYEDILEPLGFIRTHHSYLANADKIKSYIKTDGGALLLEGGFSIPVSQRKKDVVLQALGNRS
jgi:two-component system LytT family response regulator